LNFELLLTPSAKSFNMPHLERHVFVCTNERGADNPKGSCARSGGAEVRDALKAALAARGLNKRIRANSAGCLDQCERGVAMVVYPEQVWYGNIKIEDIEEIVESHLIQGNVVQRLLIDQNPQALSHISAPLPRIEPAPPLIKLGKPPSKPS
jgi:(2Fe-2S) ferredoxin